jgi:hypothetical protein
MRTFSTFVLAILRAGALVSGILLHAGLGETISQVASHEKVK